MHLVVTMGALYGLLQTELLSLSGWHTMSLGADICLFYHCFLYTLYMHIHNIYADRVKIPFPEDFSFRLGPTGSSLAEVKRNHVIVYMD